MYYYVGISMRKESIILLGHTSTLYRKISHSVLHYAAYHLCKP